MKQFIIDCGRGLIDFCTGLSLLVVLIVGIISLFTGQFLAGLCILIIGALAIIISSYLLYLLIDMRDSLDKIAAHFENSKSEG